MDNGRSGVIYDFGAYQVDPLVRRVYSGSETLPLTPKAFDTLLILIANRGKVVLKAELIDRLWPDTAVEENNLTQQIATLRRCFGERAGDHRYIVTVPGKGYSFVAPVSEIICDKEASCDHIGQPLSATEVSPDRFAVWARSGGGFGAMLAAAYIILVCLTSIVAYQNDKGRSGYATTVVVMGFSASDGYDSAIGAGIRDTLRARIGSVQDVELLPARYPIPPTDVMYAGRSEKADVVLTGSVQRNADQIRIAVEMVDINRGYVVWGKTFDYRSPDVFATQDRIAGEVLKALARRLS